jgi:hypothetical protein
MRAGVFVLAAALGAPPAAAGPSEALRFDADGDGVADLSASAVSDIDNDGAFDPGIPACGGSQDSVEFAPAWNSGSVLNNQWDAACGYFDDDSLLDILGHHWNPNELHVFESDGAGGYTQRWQQTEAQPPASYVSVTAGDPDDDDEIELLGGDASTLCRVVVFENLGNDTWGQPYSFNAASNERIRTVRVADTDQDDTSEIIVITGNTDGGGVYIFEHTGAAGVHEYTLRYHYSTVSYLFQAEVGDADNDGYPEILLGVGGMHGYPMNIRRIVYDPASRSYSHRLFQSVVIGLPISALAGNTDASGGNELVVGSSDGEVHVFKHTSGDTFEQLWQSSFAAGGNIIALGEGAFTGYPCPVVAAASFAGNLHAFTWDQGGYRGVGELNPSTGAAIRSVDVARDGREALILAESAPSDFVSVWRRSDAQAVSEDPAEGRGRMRVRPNPSREPVSIELVGGRPAGVYDAGGRLVKRLRPGRATVWSGEDAAGRRVGPGLYFIRTAGAPAVAVVRY